jgi:cytochrome P450
VQQNGDCRLSLTNVYLPEYAANPYPLYHMLREHDPVFWDEAAQRWVLTRYTDAVTALRDPRLSAARFIASMDWVPDAMLDMLGPPIRALTRQILFLDPPDHTRLRSLMVKAFTPRIVEAMRSHIQHIVDDLLDKVLPNGQMELIHDFAYPLPAIVIAEMLGVPPEDHQQFTRWTGNFGSILESNDLSLEQAIKAFLGVSEFMDYFRAIIAQRRIEPGDDLIQAFLNAEEGGHMLSEEELLGNCVLLLAAGHGTTTHLIGNGLLALLQHPHQYQLLKDNPNLISLAAMELLRYDGPVQATARHVSEDITIDGKHITAGQRVIISLGAANRDPAQFSEPDTLNLYRQENRHLAFGHGIHYCLGAPLARLEAEIAFNTLLRRLQQPQVNMNEVDWASGMIFRGLNKLPIVFD